MAKGNPLRPATATDYRRLLESEILPAIGNLAAASVTRQHVIDIVNKVANRGSTRRADTARAVISSIYSHGLDRGLVSENPASGLKNRHENEPRGVILTDAQMRKAWQAMDDGDAIMSRSMVRIFKLALVTGQRRAEIAGIKLTELDVDRAVLTIPRGRAKNRNEHRVPLSPQAVRIVREALSETGSSEVLFPGPTGDPIQPRSVSKAMERLRDKLGLGGITVHDLRRTVGSKMASYGVPKEIRERVLNHGGKRSGSVTEKHYSVYDYDTEKRAALELWADALDCILSGRPGEIEDYSSRLARLKGTSQVLVG